MATPYTTIQTIQLIERLAKDGLRDSAELPLIEIFIEEIRDTANRALKELKG